MRTNWYVGAGALLVACLQVRVGTIARHPVKLISRTGTLPIVQVLEHEAAFVKVKQMEDRDPGVAVFEIGARGDVANPQEATVVFLIDDERKTRLELPIRLMRPENR